MAWGQGAPDMSYWLGRKYALMQQNADAGDFQNQTQRTGVDAAARVDNMKANLMPVESAANVGLVNANARSVNENTNWIAPLNRANIANTNAQTSYIGTQDKDLTRRALTPFDQVFGGGMRPSMGNLMGGGRSMFRPLPPETPRRTNETGLAYLDRINGF